MGSILRAADGVGKFEMPREGVIVITFDDRKTTVAKIIQSLEKGRFTVRGKPVYVKPGAYAQQGASSGKIDPSPQGSSPGARSKPTQGLSPPSISQPPPELPLYDISLDSSGTTSR